VTDVKEILGNYSRLLVSSWDIIELISKKDETGSLKIDWLQANWEILVEGMFGGSKTTLIVYGEGADCNGASSRVLYPERSPTHKIRCIPLKGSRVYDILNDQDLDTSRGEVIFDRFVSISEDGWYYEKPNFDYVLADYDGSKVVVNFTEVGFEIMAIMSS